MVIVIIRGDGSRPEYPHWFELAKEKWVQVCKTTGTSWKNERKKGNSRMIFLLGNCLFLPEISYFWLLT